MARGGKADWAVAQGIHQIQIFLTGNAEHIANVGVFQAAYEQVGTAVLLRHKTSSCSMRALALQAHWEMVQIKQYGKSERHSQIGLRRRPFVVDLRSILRVLASSLRSERFNSTRSAPLGPERRISRGLSNDA